MGSEMVFVVLLGLVFGSSRGGSGRGGSMVGLTRGLGFDWKCLYSLIKYNTHND